MTRALLLAVAAAWMLSSLPAHSETYLYGQLNLATEYSRHYYEGRQYGASRLDPGYAPYSFRLPRFTQSNTSTFGRNSHIGIHGREALGGDLEAIWKLEFASGIGALPDWDKWPRDDQALDRRETWVGLRGHWGELLAGHIETPLHAAFDHRFDPFADTAADADAHYMEAFDQTRANGLLYRTPDIHGLSLSLALLDSLRMPWYTDGADVQEIDGEDHSAALLFEHDDYYLAAAYEARMNRTAPVNPYWNPRGDWARYRIGAGVRLGDWDLSAVYGISQAPFDRITSGGVTFDITELLDIMSILQRNMIQQEYRDDLITASLSAAYRFGNNRLKMRLFRADDDYLRFGGGIALGLDHYLSERTRIYGLFLESKVLLKGTDYSQGTAEWDEHTRVFSIGLSHRF